jgi:superfamily II DNA or RNA helicase/very-short-patch-repair endonuclease
VTFADMLVSTSYLEDAFLRWVLTPATTTGILGYVSAQHPVPVGEHTYRLDYRIAGTVLDIAVELDGFAFHSDRGAFTYDRVRQNDLAATGLTVLRYSYDAIRLDTARCVSQLQAVLRNDPALSAYVIANPLVPVPDMAPDPLWAIAPSPQATNVGSYFDRVRGRLDRRPLRTCQQDALAALANYYAAGETKAACVMSVGAGKTALGVAAVLAFTRRRALIVTPGSVIRGTFETALDPTSPRNVLYGLPGGPIIPGAKDPATLVLDSDDRPISSVTREELLAADVIVTNFHSLGSAGDPGSLLAKLHSADIDFIVVDEAHIAAADSYQRLFEFFPHARTLLMSACFARLDGRPIDADVVFRYRLIDSIADGNAKNLRIRRFAPDASATTYEIVWPGGRREQIVGRTALLDVISDEHKLARITAKSDEPIRQVMRVVRRCLDEQALVVYPIRPRVLFAAMGEAHAQQISALANEHGIACATLHHSMSDGAIAATRARFERESGDLQGIVQLRMLGQGYDFPPITVVVPMRPYGGFGEFYQFVGRGIRVLTDPAVRGRVTAEQQFLDLVYHAELGLDAHVETIRIENDMDPAIDFDNAAETDETSDDSGGAGDGFSNLPDALVLFEQGTVIDRVMHDADRIEARRTERELEALAQRYAVYAATTHNPSTFEQFVAVIRGSRA